MKNNDIYKQVEGCLLEDMDGEMLLYSPTTAVTLHLNGSSATIWQLCDGKRSVQEITEVVQEAYPDQAEQINEDVARVLGDFGQRKVIQLVE